MSERCGGGYRELEEELINESIERFIASNVENADTHIADTSDYRSIKALANAENQGFLMKQGQYADILHK